MRKSSALLIAFVFSAAAAYADFPLFIPASCCGTSTARVAMTATGEAFVWTGDGLRAAVTDGTLPIPANRQILLSSSNYRDPAIASDGRNAIAVWVENGSLFFMQLGPDVNVIDREILAQDVGAAAPAVAWNGTKYVIAWSHVSNAVLAATVDASGRTGTTIHVLQNSQTAVPKVISIASSGGNALAVWDRTTYDLTCACPPTTEVDSVVVDPDGGVAGPLSTLAASGSDPHLAWNGNEFFVLWSGAPAGGLFGRRVSIGGSPIDEEPLAIAPPADYQARIAWNGTSYFVIWQHQVFAQFQVYYAPMNESGTLGALTPFAGRLTPGSDIAADANGSVVLVHDASGLITQPPMVRFLEPRRRAVPR